MPRLRGLYGERTRIEDWLMRPIPITPAEDIRRAELGSHLKENRPFVRKRPVSRATRGETNIPMWLTGKVM